MPEQLQFEYDGLHLLGDLPIWKQDAFSLPELAG